MHLIRLQLFLVFMFMWQLLLPGQHIVALESKWADTFKEWTIHTENDSIEGNLELLWKMENDWSEWTFELGEQSGKIRLRNQNPGFWEFRSGNEIITAQTVWPGDPTEWRFTDGKHVIKLKSKYYDIPSVWYTSGEEHGYMDIYREYEEDPNVWLVDDVLNDEISPLYRIGLIFIAVYYSIPKI